MLFGAKENREANRSGHGKHKRRHDPSCAGPGQPRAPFAPNPKSSGKAPSRAGGLRGGHREAGIASSAGLAAKAATEGLEGELSAPSPRTCPAHGRINSGAHSFSFAAS